MHSNSEYLFIFAGRRDSGKSLAAHMFAAITGLTLGEAARVLYEQLARELGCQTWELEAQDKEQLIPELDRIGAEMRASGPTAVLKPLVDAGARVIDGPWQRDELCELRGYAISRGMLPVVVWLDRDAGNTNTRSDLSIGDADVVVRNHGDVARLSNRISELAAEFTFPTDLLPEDFDPSGPFGSGFDIDDGAPGPDDDIPPAPGGPYFDD